MTKFSTPALLLSLIAVGAAGCDLSWRASNETGAKDVGKGAGKPTQTVASLPASPGAPAAALAAAPSTPQPPSPAPPQRMTNAQEADFNAWIVKTYLGCWRPAALPADSDPYVARVRLAFKPDGSLAKTPKLVNPPSDPALKPQAKSVMQAVQACNPLPVPAQYRPFYEQWRSKTVHFNPQVAAR
jgi:hypothetical protein